MRSTRGAGTACSPAGSRATGTPHAVGDRVIGARGAGAPSAAACGALARGTCRAARRFEASSQLSTHHPQLATLATHNPQLATLTDGFSTMCLGQQSLFSQKKQAPKTKSRCFGKGGLGGTTPTPRKRLDMGGTSKSDFRGLVTRGATHRTPEIARDDRSMRPTPRQGHTDAVPGVCARQDRYASRER